VNHYDAFFHLGLTDSEKRDLVEYLKSLGDDVPSPVRSASELNAGVALESEDATETSAPAELTLRPSPVVRGGLVNIDLAIADGRGLPGDFQAAVYDIAGRRVAELKPAALDAESGRATLRWDTKDSAGRPIGPGVYFVRAAAPSLNFSQERRLVIR